MLEEAEKRDHRRLGTQLDLFHLQEEAPGMVFWHPKGWALWQAGRAVHAPRLPRQRLPGGARARRSSTARCGRSPGHWENYRENMFTTESEKRDYAVKPMNCPGHVQIFKQGMRATATCRCATASSAPATATSPRARCTASCACAASRRTTATSSAPRSRSSTSACAYTALLQKVYARLRLHRHHLQDRDAPGEAHRLRRELGQGRARADASRCGARASSSRSRPARARSTARRSSTR